MRPGDESWAASVSGADGVDRSTLSAAVAGVPVMASTVAVDHVGTTAKTHHEIEQTAQYQKPEQTFHSDLLHCREARRPASQRDLALRFIRCAVPCVQSAEKTPA
jgi:hypothetical protein